jgi:transcriptional regulator with XRE-family HTH domain
MANVRVDVDTLHAALDAAREQEGMSWRELSRVIGVSASTMSRLAQGQNPDINAFAKMVRWMRADADSFIVDDDEADRPAAPGGGDGGSDVEPPALVAQLAPLLRARPDLGKADIELIEALIESAVRRFGAERTANRSAKADDG